jgi:hypothetical protein
MADLKISALTASTTPLAGTEVLPIVQSSTTKQVSVANLTAGRAMSAATITSTGVTSALVFTGNNNGTYPTQQAGGVLSYNASGGFSEVNFWNTGSGTPYYSFTWLQQSGASSKTTLMTLNTTELTLPGNIVPSTAAKGINFTANSPAAGMTSQLLNWYEDGTWTPNQGSGLTVVGAFSSTGKYTRVGREVRISGTVTGATSVAVTAAGIITTNLPFTSGTAGHGNATNAAINAFAAIICTTTNVTSAGAIAATGTITFSATYFV